MLYKVKSKSRLIQ